MNQPSPLLVPAELLDGERLSDLLDLLRDNPATEFAVDLSPLRRIPTPVVQLLLAARRDGVRLRLDGPTPPLAATLRVLGLERALLAGGTA